MALKKEIYQEFEDIVGAKYISDDPALLDTYRYPLMHTAIHLGPYYGVYTPRGRGRAPAGQHRGSPGHR